MIQDPRTVSQRSEAKIHLALLWGLLKVFIDINPFPWQHLGIKWPLVILGESQWQQSSPWCSLHSGCSEERDVSIMLQILTKFTER